MSSVLFPCKDCSYDVMDCRKEGRFYEHRQIIILLPADFNVPRCVNPDCKQEWFSEDLLKKFELVLEEEYQKDAGLIRSIIEFHQSKTQK